MRRFLFLSLALFALAGCENDPVTKTPVKQAPINHRSTPQEAIRYLISTFEQKNETEYKASFTGDFTFEFSTSTDPTLVQQYSTGWFKPDESASAAHLFAGYTPPGGPTLPAAATIVIHLANDVPVPDSTSGVDPTTHYLLATRVDGSITVPQPGSEPLTYVITNNYSVFYIVRGDVAVGLDSTQPADAQHWYVYRWVDLTEATPKASRPSARANTWASIKAAYR